MPEGPEIRLAADEVGAAIIGKRAQEVWFAFDQLAHYGEILRGVEITAVSTRGKAMLTDFANGYTIYSHNQLYGVWVVRNAYDYPDTKRQLRLAIHTENKSALLYSASSIEVWPTVEIEQHPFIKKLGVELLDDTVTVDDVIAQFNDKRFAKRRLYGLLLDQTFLSGLGNYLRSEILFAGRTHPNMRPVDCTPEQIHALAKASLDMTRQSYTDDGVTIDLPLYRSQIAAGVRHRLARWWVFERETYACHICGAPIVKEAFGGRRLYYCSVDQPWVKE